MLYSVMLDSVLKDPLIKMDKKKTNADMSNAGLVSVTAAATASAMFTSLCAHQPVTIHSTHMVN